jgi:hypothetical protein
MLCGTVVKQHHFEKPVKVMMAYGARLISGWLQSAAVKP